MQSMHQIMLHEGQTGNSLETSVIRVLFQVYRPRNKANSAYFAARWSIKTVHFLRGAGYLIKYGVKNGTTELASGCWAYPSFYQCGEEQCLSRVSSSIRIFFFLQRPEPHICVLHKT